VVHTSFYRSTDGGETFEVLKGSPGGDDYHNLWINPKSPCLPMDGGKGCISSEMILGADQGASVSLNAGRTWSTWYNQPTGQMYHLSTDNQFPNLGRTSRAAVSIGRLWRCWSTVLSRKPRPPWADSEYATGAEVEKALVNYLNKAWEVQGGRFLQVDENVRTAVAKLAGSAAVNPNDLLHLSVEEFAKRVREVLPEKIPRSQMVHLYKLPEKKHVASKSWWRRGRRRPIRSWAK